MLQRPMMIPSSCALLCSHLSIGQGRGTRLVQGQDMVYVTVDQRSSTSLSRCFHGLVRALKFPNVISSVPPVPSHGDNHQQHQLVWFPTAAVPQQTSAVSVRAASVDQTSTKSTPKLLLSLLRPSASCAAGFSIAASSSRVGSVCWNSSSVQHP